MEHSRASALATASGVVIALTLLFLPPAARAGTVRATTAPLEDEPDELVTSIEYRAAPSEVNRVTVTADGDSVTIRDTAGVVPRGRCRRLRRRDTTTARCTGPYPELALLLGDRSDVARVTGTGAFLFGGSGNDVMVVHSVEPTEFTGGPGNDYMRGGSYFYEGARKNGRDTMIGDPRQGRPEVDYSHRRRPVWADLDGRRDDGERGERDRIVHVRDLIGGRAGDRLAGDRHANVLVGGRGRNRLSGGDGNDTLEGGGGGTLIGGRGDDSLEGGQGADRLFPGPGKDWVSGGAGDDAIPAEDGAFDEVNSGSGCDRVSLDAGDSYLATQGFSPLENPSDVACRSVARAGVPGFTFLPGSPFEGQPFTFEVRVGISRHIAYITAACPADAAGPCEGTVSMLADGGPVGSANFSIARNDYKDRLEVPLDTSFVARHEPGTGARATVVVSFNGPDGQPVERRTPVNLFFYYS